MAIESIRMTESAKEGSVAELSGVLRDQAGAVITESRLTGLRFTLKDASGNVVNSRDDVNILNANGGAVDASGNFTLLLRAADHSIADQTVLSETRYAIITKIWDAANQKTDIDVIRYDVKNLKFVPLT